MSVTQSVRAGEIATLPHYIIFSSSTPTIQLATMSIEIIRPPRSHVIKFTTLRHARLLTTSDVT